MYFSTLKNSTNGKPFVILILCIASRTSSHPWKWYVSLAIFHTMGLSSNSFQFNNRVPSAISFHSLRTHESVGESVKKAAFVCKFFPIFRSFTWQVSLFGKCQQTNLPTYQYTIRKIQYYLISHLFPSIRIYFHTNIRYTRNGLIMHYLSVCIISFHAYWKGNQTTIFNILT